MQRESVATDANAKSGGEVAELAMRRSHGSSKFSAVYWGSRLFRRSWTEEGGIRRSSDEYAVRIQHGGRRAEVGLATANRGTAAQRAANLYRDVRTLGWDEALKRLDPERATTRPRCQTLGDYAAEVRKLGVLSETTLAGYVYACRWFAAGILVASRDRSRFDYKKGGSAAWRAKLDAIPLERLTAEAAERVMTAFFAAAGSDPRQRRRAAQSANSFARNARSLFGRKIMRRLPEPLFAAVPFAGLQLLDAGPTRYVSTFDWRVILAAARTELRESDPNAWVAFLLALGAGLRRGEIDALTWMQVREEERAIWIGPTDAWQPKTATSEGLVHVDSFVIDELGAHRTRSNASFVIAGLPAFPRHGARCQAVFDRLTEWLRKNGVEADKPIHLLRKEFGSIVAQNADIFTASRQLRHGDIGTTARYYAENRRKVAPDLGAMLRQQG